MKKIFTAIILFLIVLDLNAKIIYVDPVQNSKYVSTHNSIIIGFDDAVKSTDINSLITVTGSLSGIHEGKIVLAQNGKKLIFKPTFPFALNETVEVKINGLKTTSKNNNSLTFSFETRGEKPVANQYSDDIPEYKLINDFPGSYNSLPMPLPTVTISNNPSPGRLLLCNLNFGTGYTSYAMTVNNDASIFHTIDLGNAADYTRQNNGTLTYYRNNKYFSVDSLYNVTDSFYCGNGYTTDAHDLRLLNNGHALVMSYDSLIIDMSQLVPGGYTNAKVIGFIVQEIDENKNVVFQWRSWDYFDILDAVDVIFTGTTVDPVHGNAMELDNDGNIMISSRHLNEITKINRTTGALIWRMGGVNNQFTFVNDTIPFHYQHDIRRIENGNVTMFDNGNFRTPLVSRALEYQLDEVNKVATLVWSYQNSPVVYGAFMGSVQRLKNGNTLIGWGGTSPVLTEVTPSGTIVLEMKFPAGVFSYRAFRDEVNITLNVKLALEGMFNTFTNKLSKKDTVTVYVRNSSSPYSIVDSQKTTVDTVTMNANCRLYNATAGTYYISVKHRNGLETWSKAGGETFVTNGVYNYDFRSSASMAFGNNLILKGTKYCIISGDVNQDGTIDASDLSQTENDAFNGLSGYVNTDVTGDDFVDAADISVVANNAAMGVSVVIP